MKKLHFNASNEQYNALWSLAYWMQEITHEKEQNGGKDAVFLKDARQRINDLFSQLDRLQVPFWAQNAAIAIGENWKKYHQIGVPSLFRASGIYFGTM